MMPLCTTASSLPEKCGWALRSQGAPWVAQRVWAIPRRPGSGWSARACSSSATLPERRQRSRRPSSPSTATPALSYPRYSRRFRPSRRIAVILRSATAPTMPHIGTSPLCLDAHADQLDPTGGQLFTRVRGQAVVADEGMYAAPGQLQIGNLAPDLVGLGHHDHLAGDFGHHPGKTEQLVEGGGAAGQVDAVGADEQLIEVVGAQHLLGHLALEGFRVGVPGA